MGRKKIYQTEAQKKEADKERKRLKRAADKDESSKKLNSDLITQILLNLANDVVYKVHRKVNNSNQKASRREKEKKISTSSSAQCISTTILPPKSSNAKAQAVKRAAVREPVNPLAKRQKYDK